jgi:hypothetical protein
MSRWFRFYDEALNDPKVQRLSGDLFKAWANFLCLASKNNGAVLRADVTFALRFTDETETDFYLGKLIEANLIEDRGDVLVPHNWDKRQYKSDTSTDRVKRFRNGGKPLRKRKATVSETPPDTEQNRTEQKDNTCTKGEFEEFWKSYPKRKGSNRKSPAERLFNSAVKAGVTPAEIIFGARKFAESEATNVGTPYIPQAVKWLRDKGWEEFKPDPAEEERRRQLWANMEAKGWRWINEKWVKPEEAA